MRDWLVLPLLVLSLAAPAGCATGGGDRPVDAGGGAGVLSVVEEHAAAFSAKDIGSMLVGVSPDIEWYSIDAENVTLELQGREALRDAMLTYFAETPTFRSQIEDAVVSGAFVSVRERASWDTRQGTRSQTAIAVFEVRDGLIRRVWYYPAQR